MAANNGHWHRNLSKVELGGVILDCSNDNIRKSLSSKLFGLPVDRFVYVRNIKKGLPLFLFNTDDRKLRGVYEAACSGERRIALDEWTGEEYPARVRICVSRDYPLLALAEHQFKHIIAGNYYSGKDFQFELDQDQARKLTSLFFSLGMPVLHRQLLRQMKEVKSYKQEYTLKMERLHKRLDQSIFIVGGYHGENCSSTLYSFSPSDDTLRSLESMSSVRSYASVAKIDREFYVLGGWSGSISNNTVESYNPHKDCWTQRPSLKERRSLLAAAALDGKLFAIGGGDEVQCFSSVEMFDPEIGRWTSASSMLERRIGFGAVEFDGAIYAVGGYDGNNYLESAERYDPRDNSWSRIGSMGTKRHGHSLVVLNEKLYAIGGYVGPRFVGSTLLSSVEIYDPRLDTWIDGEPMNQARGYAVAAVVNDSIFVIGGTKSHGHTLIECYKEGQGWEATTLRAAGLRCEAASGIVLGED